MSRGDRVIRRSLSERQGPLRLLATNSIGSIQQASKQPASQPFKGPPNWLLIRPPTLVLTRSHRHMSGNNVIASTETSLSLFKSYDPIPPPFQTFPNFPRWRYPPLKLDSLPLKSDMAERRVGLFPTPD